MIVPTVTRGLEVEWSTVVDGVSDALWCNVEFTQDGRVEAVAADTYSDDYEFGCREDAR